MGYSVKRPSEIIDRNSLRAGEALQMLKKHPNYKDQEPFKGETLIAYTLRCCAHLVSPPQNPEESYDVECVDIASGILALEKEIIEKWNKYNTIN